MKYISRQQIKKITSKIVDDLRPEKVILFGSYAWGKPNQDSDVDLFIIKKNKKDFLKEQQKTRRIINGELPVDILIHTPQEVKKRINLGDFFYINIMKKGVRLYEK